MYSYSNLTLRSRIMRSLISIPITAALWVSNGPAFAQNLPDRQSDAALATQLTDCHNGLTAIEGLATIVDAKIDLERLSSAKRMSRLGSIALVGDVQAKDIYSVSKEKLKTELALALDNRPNGVSEFFQRYTDLCSKVFEQNGTYIGERIADEMRRRNRSQGDVRQ